MRDIAQEVADVVRERRDELPALLRSRAIVAKELLEGRILTVGEERVNGFVFFRCRKDGTITLYEIAKRKESEGSSVCTVLVECLKEAKKPILLKCSVRNKKAKQFWDRMGFRIIGSDKRWNKYKNRYSIYYVMEWR